VKNILLDTHSFIWWIEDSPRLSTLAKKIVENLDNNCFFSLASCWELAIKSSMGRIKLTLPIRDFIPQHLAANDFKQLSISLRHGVCRRQLQNFSIRFHQCTDFTERNKSLFSMYFLLHWCLFSPRVRPLLSPFVIHVTH